LPECSAFPLHMQWELEAIYFLRSCSSDVNLYVPFVSYNRGSR